MPKLVKNAEVIENTISVLDKESTLDAVTDNSLVPLALFLENAEACLAFTNTGVWIDSDEGPEALESYLDKLDIIGVNFPKFADGRGYSYARLLRERFAFKGEIRAVGDVLHDQLYYMSRCGFDAFAIREDKDADEAAKGLNDFSEAYQTGVDQPLPLFRRRA